MKQHLKDLEKIGNEKRGLRDLKKNYKGPKYHDLGDLENLIKNKKRGQRNLEKTSE